ncbi:MAG: SMC-Scp complex subunit ScpB [Clostridia bacterium]|nr:SMC-Scp complex subunit ScpB [Clostridia bacterium]
MKVDEMQAAVEAILFAAGEPIEYERIAEALEIEPEYAENLLMNLGAQLDERGSGICLVRMDDQFQLCTRSEYADKVRTVLEIKKNSPLSNAAFEVLAVIAYNQPVTKSFIEQVRGVDCSGVISTLCQKGLIEEKGRLDLPGRPLLYGTTPEFLKCFSVTSLDELPDLPEHEDIPEKPEIPDQLSLDLSAENDTADGEIEEDGEQTDIQ